MPRPASLILFSLLTLTHAADIYLKSHCDFPIWIREVVSDTYNPYDDTLTSHEIPPRGSWTSHFWTNRGVSIKLARTPWTPYGWQPPISQVEYTYEPFDNTARLWYDLSEIDCYTEADGYARSDDCPFYNEGISIRTLDQCQEFRCDPDVPECPDAYNHPKDDWETAACDGDVKLFVDACLATADGEADYDAPDAPGTDTAGTQTFAKGERQGGVSLKENPDPHPVHFPVTGPPPPPDFPHQLPPAKMRVVARPHGPAKGRPAQNLRQGSKVNGMAPPNKIGRRGRGARVRAL